MSQYSKLLQGTVVSMIIPQAGLPDDILPTVTAFISATPNLGGVLGVGIIGTGGPIVSGLI